MNHAKATLIIPRFQPLGWLLRPRMPVFVALLFALVLLISVKASYAADPYDPLEPVNRITFQFNQAVDGIVVKPLAKSYDRLVPGVARHGIGNFFRNLGELNSAANAFLQFKFKQGSTSLIRLAVNSTVGLAGVLDIATEIGMPRHREDFGQTLAAWGMDSGPYIVLPLFGPSTPRGVAGLGIAALLNPVNSVDPVQTRNALTASNLVDQRAGILPLEQGIFGDPYLFVREAYRQQRKYLANDGAMELVFEDF